MNEEKTSTIISLRYRLENPSELFGFKLFNEEHPEEHICVKCSELPASFEESSITVGTKVRHKLSIEGGEVTVTYIRKVEGPMRGEGRVAMFDKSRGYGFIKTNDTKGQAFIQKCNGKIDGLLFFHWNEVMEADGLTINEGDKVLFVYNRKDKTGKACAASVKFVKQKKAEALPPPSAKLFPALPRREGLYLKYYIDGSATEIKIEENDYSHFMEYIEKIERSAKGAKEKQKNFWKGWDRVQSWASATEEESPPVTSRQSVASESGSAKARPSKDEEVSVGGSLQNEPSQSKKGSNSSIASGTEQEQEAPEAPEDDPAKHTYEHEDYRNGRKGEAKHEQHTQNKEDVGKASEDMKRPKENRAAQYVGGEYPSNDTPPNASKKHTAELGSTSSRNPFGSVSSRWPDNWQDDSDVKSTRNWEYWESDPSAWNADWQTPLWQEPPWESWMTSHGKGKGDWNAYGKGQHTAFDECAYAKGGPWSKGMLWKGAPCGKDWMFDQKGAYFHGNPYGKGPSYSYW